MTSACPATGRLIDKSENADVEELTYAEISKAFYAV
jgi:hypothetical protein